MTVSLRSPLLATLMLAALPLRANDGWQVTTWTTDNALPQGVVYAIHQTGDGYLWFTTLGGLVRYDGVEFTVYAKATTPGLRSSRFTTLLEAAGGALWAGTEDGFVSVYRSGAFTTYSVDGSLAPVLAISAEGTARPWVVTQNGIFVFDGLRFVRAGSSIVSTRNMYRTGTAAIGDSVVVIQKPGAPPRMLPFEHLVALIADDDSLWIADADRGIFRLRQGKLTAVDNPALLETVRADGGPIGALTQSRDGAYWIALSRRGIARVDGAKVEWITPSDGLCSADLSRIYEDREGTMWATSAGGGVSAMRRRAARTYGAAEGLQPPNVFPILAWNGDLLAGTWGGGVYRFDGRRFEPSMASGLVMSLADGGDGSIWVSANRDGVLRIAGKNIRHFGEADGLPSPVVRVVYRSQDGHLWLGTNGGLAVLSGERFVSYRAASPELSLIQAIAEDRDGALLLGTRGGVARFRDGRFSVIADERSGLSSNSVRAIHLDGDGTIWIGTYDGGLNRLRNGRVAAITTRQGLFDNGVFAIVEDAGFFWMSSNRGIHRASRRELNAVADGTIRAVSSLALTRGDGMLSPECNGGVQPAAARTPDGLLWFPTQQGIVSIDPRLVGTTLAAPSIHVTSVSVDGEPAPAAAGVRVATGSKRVEFRFAAPTTAGARLIRYRYKLEGFDNRWNDLVGDRVASYTHIPPGRYRFVVSASNAEGRWSPRAATIDVRVLPPFWQTWWFIAAAAAAATALLWTIFRIRVRAIEREQAAQAEFSHRLLVQQEEERKRVAAELHDSIGQSLLIIKNRALLGMDRNSGQEQLSEISSTASSAIDEVRRIAHNLRPVELDHLGLIGSLEALLRRMSASSSILFSGDLQPIGAPLTKEAEVNIFRIVQEWLSNVARHSHAGAAVVSLQRENGTLRLRIRDDGTGFSRAQAASEERLGIGLRSIAERVQMLGGTYDIRSIPGEGTSMTVEVQL